MLEPDAWAVGRCWYYDVGQYDDIGTDWVIEFYIDDELVGDFGKEVR